MTTVVVPGVPASRKTPGVFLNVILGGAGTSSGAPAEKILLAGNKITSALTGSSPSFSVAAGTQADAAPVAIYSADDAAAYFGLGSELHLMALAVFAQYPDANVTAVSVAEAGSASTGVLTFVGTASGATTLRLTLAGQVIDVAVSSGDTPTTIATACAAAILAATNLPMTAQFAAGVLTLTAKNTGPRGNALTVRVQWISSSNVVTEVTTSAVSSGVTTTAQLSSVTTVESTYTMSTGATADNVTNALAAIVATKFDRQAWAQSDATNLGRITTQLGTLAGPTIQLREQAIVCSSASLATAITLATGNNSPRAQIAWSYNSPTPPPAVAAQLAAARLAGDAFAGTGSPISGEADNPAANLIGLELGTTIVTPFPADQPTGAEIESALNNGLTPLAPSQANPGKAVCVRSITARSLANSQPNYAVLDTSCVTAPDYIADDLQANFSVLYRGKKLGADSANGTAPKVANVVTPSMIKAQLITYLRGYEANGIVINVDAHLSDVAVVANPSVPGRVDMEIPAAIIPPLAILAGNVRQLNQ